MASTARFTLASLLFLVPLSHAAEIRAGSELQVQLTSPVATYSSKPGDAVSAVLTAPVEVKGKLLLPAGVGVTGRVTSVRKVGWGFVNEKARILLDFDKLLLPDQSEIPIGSKLVEVENAREEVDRTGTVRGIRATASLSASISSRLIHLPALNLYIDPVMLGYHLLFPVFPESEIYLPRGTDLRLRLMTPVSVPELPDNRPPELDDEDAAKVLSAAEAIPGRSVAGKKANPKPADFVSILFLGDRVQLEDAFRAAQWSSTDGRSRRSFWRYFGTFLANSGYKTAPMSKQWLGGNLPDQAWQKSLNSVAKRHHLRIWRLPGSPLGEGAWVATATRDIGMSFSLRHLRVIHFVEGDVDRERSKVVNDLAFAGCVAAYSYVTRPGLNKTGLTPEGDLMTTDSRLAAIRLKTCKPNAAPPENLAQSRPFGPPFQRYVRRQVLTFRNEILRGNVFWGTYAGVRFVWRTLRPRRDLDLSFPDPEWSQEARNLVPLEPIARGE